MNVCACAYERTRKKALSSKKEREHDEEKKQYKLQAKWSSSTNRATGNERAEKKDGKIYIY